VNGQVVADAQGAKEQPWPQNVCCKRGAEMSRPGQPTVGQEPGEHAGYHEQQTQAEGGHPKRSSH
jgi:hypothetical protein